MLRSCIISKSPAPLLLIIHVFTQVCMHCIILAAYKTFHICCFLDVFWHSHSSVGANPYLFLFNITYYLLISCDVLKVFPSKRGVFLVPLFVCFLLAFMSSLNTL